MKLFTAFVGRLGYIITGGERRLMGDVDTNNPDNKPKNPEDDGANNPDQVPSDK